MESHQSCMDHHVFTLETGFAKFTKQKSLFWFEMKVVEIQVRLNKQTWGMKVELSKCHAITTMSHGSSYFKIRNTNGEVNSTKNSVLTSNVSCEIPTLSLLQH